MATSKIWLGNKKIVNELTVADTAYLAAMIDGEGHISIVRAQQKGQKRPSYRLRVGITNTNLPLLQKLHDMVGFGSFTMSRTDHEKWKNSADLYWSQTESTLVLETILPYLKAKQERACIALEFVKLKIADAGGGDDSFAEQEALFGQMKVLNARGKINQEVYEVSQLPSKEAPKCQHSGCTDKHYANGFCRRHYRWVYESKSWNEGTDRLCKQCASRLPATARIDTKFCGVACKMQWHRAQGAYAAENRPADERKCSVEGCTRSHQAKGMCRSHYMRLWHAENGRGG